MKTPIRVLLAMLAVLALAMTVAACGDDESDSGSSDTGASTTEETASSDKLIKSDAANGSTTITVGSKNFAEQYILGEIYAQSLEAAGYNVEKQLDLGSEQIAFKSLKRGTIDAYPEYTGTALTSFYGVKTADVPRDRDESFEQLKGELEGDDITAMPQTPFENTYKVTSTKETAEKFGTPSTVSELVEEAGNDVKLSAFPECRQRSDCYLGLKQNYDWAPKFVSSQGQYADLDGGQADFTMGFSTDGPLSTGKYVTYEDDEGLFPPYFVTFMVRSEAAEKLGQEGQDIITRVQEPLTEEVMQELNSRVAIDKEKPEDVARQYLKEEGFTQ